MMALMRVKRPEALKERDPATMGRIIGLDRAPEVKTVRRKLTRLAAYHRAERLGYELAQERVEQRGSRMGFLYVDGHVRAYHGKRTLPKAFVSLRRLAMPALCEPLNEIAIKFPGTNLRLRFEVHSPPRIGLAFPGPNPRTNPANADSSAQPDIS